MFLSNLNGIVLYQGYLNCLHLIAFETQIYRYLYFKRPSIKSHGIFDMKQPAYDTIYSTLPNNIHNVPRACDGNALEVESVMIVSGRNVSPSWPR